MLKSTRFIMNKAGRDYKIAENTAVAVMPDVFDSVDETIEEATRIFACANEYRLFLSDASWQTREARKLVGRAACWVNIVRSRLDSYSYGEALKLAEVYDLMQRIAFKLPADKGFSNKIILSAFDAMIHGDREVDQYMMYKAIVRAVHQREKDFFDKPLTWVCLCLDIWYRQAIEGFDRVKISDYDILSRVNILLEADLTAYEGSRQQQFKQCLFEQHRHYLDNHDTTDRRMAAAVAKFLIISCMYLTQE